MRKWKVSIWWDIEVEAEDEGYALEEANNKFDFWDKADIEEIEEEESGDKKV